MFTVQFNGLTYKVSFGHKTDRTKEDGFRAINKVLSNREEKVKKLSNAERQLIAPFLTYANGKSRFKTRCRIIVTDGDHEEKYFGYSTCNPCDLTNKNVGKKYALRDLLDNYSDEYNSVFPRELRSILYETLFEEFPGAELSPDCRRR